MLVSEWDQRSDPSSGSSAGLGRAPNRAAPGERPPSSGASSARLQLTIHAATLIIRLSRPWNSGPDTPMIKRTRRKGGAMIKDPLVPLSTSLLPQQRLYEVKALPTWPSGVRPVVGYPGELGVPDLPKQRSRHAIYLCQAEWAWTPHHNRLAAYYLSRGRRHWLLWLGGHHDETIP